MDHAAHQRELLLEAFIAGWQAALAVNVTHPRVRAMIESCFELWLTEASDEVDVLGLPFHGRNDLPSPLHETWLEFAPREAGVSDHGRSIGDETANTKCEDATLHTAGDRRQPS